MMSDLIELSSLWFGATEHHRRQHLNHGLGGICLTIEVRCPTTNLLS